MPPMYATLCQALTIAGAALMVYNIARYLRYAQGLLHRADWERERRTLMVPIILLVCFLAGYLFVGLLGRPDIVVAGILAGGSIFVFCMILFLEHVTQRIGESERLAAQLAAAEEASRAKSSFLSTMSHEIRTPLNAIIGLNTLALADPGLSNTQRDRSEKIDGSARHLLALINNVLDMSRIESGEMSLSEEPFSLAELQEHVCSVIGSQCEAKGLDYRCGVIGAHDERYVGDATKLSQVLINILGNSVKFTDPGGAVSASVEQVGSKGVWRTLRFTLADTGIGMDKSYIPKLFGAFTQEDSSRTSQYGGSGLGMAITKRIVEMMDGTIDVQSEKGVGTTIAVTVRLRACEGAADGGCEEPVPSCGELGRGPSSSSLAGHRMLIAEDMDVNAEILAALLAMEGMSCERASDGLQAVELFAASEPGYFDAILMDVRMPVMDGLEATRTIRSLDRPDAATVPIVALTANAFAEDMRQSLEAGMNAHLSKPVEPERLTATLSGLLG